MERQENLVRNDRGQTLQDFAIGIGIFLIAFFFVLSLFPGLLTPFQSPASGAERAQAEKVSTTMVTNLSEGPRENHLNETALATVLNPSTTESQLLDRFGLPGNANLNITVESLNGTRLLYGTAKDAGDNVVATSTRLVTIQSCDPACRLVVRVW